MEKDEFLDSILDCFNSMTPAHVHADTVEEAMDKLDKAFKAGDVHKPLKFD